MGRGSDRDRVAKALFEELTAVPAPGELGREAAAGGSTVDAPTRADGPQGFLVDRVVNRRDLTEAVRNLGR